MDTRGQSALEYLMTYGWALVVIVIAVAALVVLINPGNIAGDQCDARLGSAFTIGDESTYDGTTLQLVLTNQAGRSLDANLTLSGECAATSIDNDFNTSQTRTLAIACGGGSGSYTIDIALTYATERVKGITANAQCRGDLSV